MSTSKDAWFSDEEDDDLTGAPAPVKSDVIACVKSGVDAPKCGVTKEYAARFNRSNSNAVSPVRDLKDCNKGAEDSHSELEDFSLPKATKAKQAKQAKQDEQMEVSDYLDRKLNSSYVRNWIKNIKTWEDLFDEDYMKLVEKLRGNPILVRMMADHLISEKASQKLLKSVYDSECLWGGGPTIIQRHMPEILKRISCKDKFSCCVISPSGTGKTGVIILTIISTINTEIKKPQFLVSVTKPPLIDQIVLMMKNMFMSLDPSVRPSVARVGYALDDKAGDTTRSTPIDKLNQSQILVGSPRSFAKYFGKSESNKKLNYENIKMIFADEVDEMFNSERDVKAILQVINETNNLGNSLFVMGLTATVGPVAEDNLTKCHPEFENKNVFNSSKDFIIEKSESKSALMTVEIPSMPRHEFSDSQRDCAHLAVVTQLLLHINKGNIIVAVPPYLKEYLQDRISRTFKSFVTDDPKSSKLFEKDANAIIFTPLHWDVNYPNQQPITRGCHITNVYAVIYLLQEDKSYANVEIVQAAGRLLRGNDHSNPFFRTFMKSLILVGTNKDTQIYKKKIIERSAQTVQLVDHNNFWILNFEYNEYNDIVSEDGLPVLRSDVKQSEEIQYAAIDWETKRKFRSEEKATFLQFTSPNLHSGGGRSWGSYEDEDDEQTANCDASQKPVYVDNESAPMGSSNVVSYGSKHSSLDSPSGCKVSSRVKHASMDSPSSEVSDATTISDLYKVITSQQEQINSHQHEIDSNKHEIEKLNKIIEEMSLQQKGSNSNGNKKSERNEDAEDNAVAVSVPLTPVLPSKTDVSKRKPLTIRIDSLNLVIKKGDCYLMIVLDIGRDCIEGKLILNNVITNITLEISKVNTPKSFSDWNEIPDKYSKIRIKFDVIRKKGNTLVSPV